MIEDIKNESLREREALEQQLREAKQTQSSIEPESKSEDQENELLHSQVQALEKELTSCLLSSEKVLQRFVPT